MRGQPAGRTVRTRLQQCPSLTLGGVATRQADNKPWLGAYEALTVFQYLGQTSHLADKGSHCRAALPTAFCVPPPCPRPPALRGACATCLQRVCRKCRNWGPLTGGEGGRSDVSLVFLQGSAGRSQPGGRDTRDSGACAPGAAPTRHSEGPLSALTVS